MLREMQRSAAPDASGSCMDRFHAGHYERDAKHMRTNREQLRNRRLPLSKRYVRTKQLALFGSQAPQPNAKLLPFLGGTLWSQKDGIIPFYTMTQCDQHTQRANSKGAFKGDLYIQSAYKWSKWLFNAYVELFKRQTISVKI